ncbi:MAG TPA: retropepsin-like aspartic protease [Pyrinomonadaceae bacterium]|nr:retropepsin-like aspartic protease [Pyrinomonadaceae bacterium]
MDTLGLQARALIALLAITWAAPVFGAAHSTGRRPPKTGSPVSDLPSGSMVPRPVRLREGRGLGLLVHAWVNGTGPYVFAVDTGAGTTLIRSEIARQSGMTAVNSRRTRIGGLSNNKAVSGEQVIINSLALGQSNNLFPAGHEAFIVSELPSGIDGILDPTEAYEPFGYVIDMPNRQLLAFDTTANRLKVGSEPTGGAVVRWVRESGGKRPFVRLGDNRLALIDTGSGFGLVITEYSTVSRKNQRARATVRDLGGGAVTSRRVEPTTVTIGSLVLRRVPTDILIGAHEDVPVLLGRDALYPFRITFDPASRLIEIAPSTEN